MKIQYALFQIVFFLFHLIPSSSQHWSNVTSIEISADWQAVSVSFSGRMQAAVANSLGLFLSSDFGQTWNSKTTLSNINFTGVAVSGDSGQFMTITSDNGYILRSDDYGGTWASVLSASCVLYDVAVSGTGQYQTITVLDSSGYVYITDDFGQEWVISILTSSAVDISSRVSMSQSGLYQAVAVFNGFIYESTNHGFSWNEVSPVGQYQWTDISLSSTGSYQVASINQGNILFSRDFGFTWNIAVSTPLLPWIGVSLSSSGQVVSAIALESNVIYQSSDFGITWILSQASIVPLNWRAIDISSDGTFQTAIVNNGSIYVISNVTAIQPISIPTLMPSQLSSGASTANGVEWVQKTFVSKQWYDVALSQSGEFQVAVENNGNVYLSNDYGASWNIGFDVIDGWTVSF